MSDRVFIDTCVLAYAFVAGEARQQRSLEIIADGGAVSVQVLNELANTCRKKLHMDWEETAGALACVKSFCPNPIPLTIQTHVSGVRLAQRYGFSVFDGLILAAALESNCDILYTEDLQHGQIIDGLRIENPFRAS